MKTTQPIYDQIPCEIDFGSLVWEENAINTTGGFGDIYRAKHPNLGSLALKKPRGLGGPSTDEYRHLLREADLWQAARHPNVLRFLGVWEAKGTIYLVSPWLTDGTVMDYLHAHPDADRTKFILDIAKGISYLHEIGIVHGDIKGNNTLISDTADALVADFGLAKFADNCTNPSLKGAGSTRWQCPEALRGGGRTPSSDVYSFGMTIYEILSGNIPFQGLNAHGIVHLVTTQKKRPEPEPKSSPSGLSYAKQWRAARFSWKDDPKLRPTMLAIVSWLESEGAVRGRVRVVCTGAPQLVGYIAEKGEQIVVTYQSETASIFNSSLNGPFPRQLFTFDMCQETPPTFSQNWLRLDTWIQLLSQAHIWLSRSYWGILSSTCDADIWIKSDGEIHACVRSESIAPSVQPTPEQLYPVIVSRFALPQLYFCRDSLEVRHWPAARMHFEEIDSDTLL